MENKNNILLIVVVGLIGLFIGWCIWGGGNNYSKMKSGSMHRMPDGSMMGNTMDMRSMMATMNANLSGKSGEEFDKAFIAEMIIHHEGAIDMARLAQTRGKHAEIKTLADAIISAQTTEINQMKVWYKNWYKTEFQSQ